MTQPFDDEHGDRLRRALHAEAEAVTPSAEGLERIRSKISKRHERRFGFISYSTPWLRPLAAVTAALVVCFAAVSVTPALANFVQTGHFSPDSTGGNGGDMQNSGRSHGQVLPDDSSTPVPSGSPSPSSPRPTNNGSHVVSGSCPPGEDTVTPSSTPAPGDPTTDPTPKITCQAPGGGGSDSSSAPATEPPPPTTSAQPQDPPSDPTTESAPAANPNQSP
jgi:hypothetical protein